ncbi:Myosin heavy chain, partial [Diplonema papillatum]
EAAKAEQKRKAVVPRDRRNINGASRKKKRTQNNGEGEPGENCPTARRLAPRAGAMAADAAGGCRRQDPRRGDGAASDGDASGADDVLRRLPRPRWSDHLTYHYYVKRLHNTDITPLPSWVFETAKEQQAASPAADPADTEVTLSFSPLLRTLRPPEHHPEDDDATLIFPEDLATSSSTTTSLSPPASLEATDPHLQNDAATPPPSASPARPRKKAKARRKPAPARAEDGGAEGPCAAQDVGAGGGGPVSPATAAGGLDGSLRAGRGADGRQADAGSGGKGARRVGSYASPKSGQACRAHVDSRPLNGIPSEQRAQLAGSYASPKSGQECRAHADGKPLNGIPSDQRAQVAGSYASPKSRQGRRAHADGKPLNGIPSDQRAQLAGSYASPKSGQGCRAPADSRAANTPPSAQRAQNAGSYASKAGLNRAARAVAARSPVDGSKSPPPTAAASPPAAPRAGKASYAAQKAGASTAKPAAADGGRRKPAAPPQSDRPEAAQGASPGLLRRQHTANDAESHAPQQLQDPKSRSQRASRDKPQVHRPEAAQGSIPTLPRSQHTANDAESHTLQQLDENKASLSQRARRDPPRGDRPEAAQGASPGLLHDQHTASDAEPQPATRAEGRASTAKKRAARPGGKRRAAAPPEQGTPPAASSEPPATPAALRTRSDQAASAASPRSPEPDELQPPADGSTDSGGSGISGARQARAAAVAGSAGSGESGRCDVPQARAAARRPRAKEGGGAPLGASGKARCGNCGDAGHHTLACRQKQAKPLAMKLRKLSSSLKGLSGNRRDLDSTAGSMSATAATQGSPAQDASSSLKGLSGSRRDLDSTAGSMPPAAATQGSPAQDALSSLKNLSGSRRDLDNTAGSAGAMPLTAAAAQGSPAQDTSSSVLTVSVSDKDEPTASGGAYPAEGSCDLSPSSESASREAAVGGRSLAPTGARRRKAPPGAAARRGEAAAPKTAAELLALEAVKFLSSPRPPAALPSPEVIHYTDSGVGESCRLAPLPEEAGEAADAREASQMREPSPLYTESPGSSARAVYASGVDTSGDCALQLAADGYSPVRSMPRGARSMLPSAHTDTIEDHGEASMGPRKSTVVRVAKGMGGSQTVSPSCDYSHDASFSPSLSPSPHVQDGPAAFFRPVEFQDASSDDTANPSEPSPMCMSPYSGTPSPTARVIPATLDATTPPAGLPASVPEAEAGLIVEPAACDDADSPQFEAKPRRVPLPGRRRSAVPDEVETPRNLADGEAPSPARTVPQSAAPAGTRNESPPPPSAEDRLSYCTRDARDSFVHAAATSMPGSPLSTLSLAATPLGGSAAAPGQRGSLPSSGFSIPEPDLLFPGHSAGGGRESRGRASCSDDCKDGGEEYDEHLRHLRPSPSIPSVESLRGAVPMEHTGFGWYSTGAAPQAARLFGFDDELGCLSTPSSLPSIAPRSLRGSECAPGDGWMLGGNKLGLVLTEGRVRTMDEAACFRKASRGDLVSVVSVEGLRGGVDRPGSDEIVGNEHDPQVADDVLHAHLVAAGAADIRDPRMSPYRAPPSASIQKRMNAPEVLPRQPSREVVRLPSFSRTADISTVPRLVSGVLVVESCSELSDGTNDSDGRAELFSKLQPQRRGAPAADSGSPPQKKQPAADGREPWVQQAAAQQDKVEELKRKLRRLQAADTTGRPSPDEQLARKRESLAVLRELESLQTTIQDQARRQSVQSAGTDGPSVDELKRRLRDLQAADATDSTPQEKLARKRESLAVLRELEARQKTLQAQSRRASAAEPSPADEPKRRPRDPPASSAASDARLQQSQAPPAASTSADDIRATEVKLGHARGEADRQRRKVAALQQSVAELEGGGPARAEELRRKRSLLDDACELQALQGQRVGAIEKELDALAMTRAYGTINTGAGQSLEATDASVDVGFEASRRVLDETRRQAAEQKARAAEIERRLLASRESEAEARAVQNELERTRQMLSDTKTFETLGRLHSAAVERESAALEASRRYEQHVAVLSDTRQKLGAARAEAAKQKAQAASLQKELDEMLRTQDEANVTESELRHVRSLLSDAKELEALQIQRAAAYERELSALEMSQRFDASLIEAEEEAAADQEAAENELRRKQSLLRGVRQLEDLQLQRAAAYDRELAALEMSRRHGSTHDGALGETGKKLDTARREAAKQKAQAARLERELHHMLGAGDGVAATEAELREMRALLRDARTLEDLQQKRAAAYEREMKALEMSQRLGTANDGEPGAELSETRNKLNAARREAAKQKSQAADLERELSHMLSTGGNATEDELREMQALLRDARALEALQLKRAAAYERELSALEMSQRYGATDDGEPDAELSETRRKLDAARREAAKQKSQATDLERELTHMLSAGDGAKATEDELREMQALLRDARALEALQLKRAAAYERELSALEMSQRYGAGNDGEPDAELSETRRKLDTARREAAKQKSQAADFEGELSHMLSTGGNATEGELREMQSLLRDARALEALQLKRAAAYERELSALEMSKRHAEPPAAEQKPRTAAAERGQPGTLQGGPDAAGDAVSRGQAFARDARALEKLQAQRAAAREHELSLAEQSRRHGQLDPAQSEAGGRAAPETSNALGAALTVDDDVNDVKNKLDSARREAANQQRRAGTLKHELDGMLGSDAGAGGDEIRRMQSLLRDTTALENLQLQRVAAYERELGALEMSKRHGASEAPEKAPGRDSIGVTSPLRVVGDEAEKDHGSFEPELAELWKLAGGGEPDAPTTAHPPRGIVANPSASTDLPSPPPSAAKPRAKPDAFTAARRKQDHLASAREASRLNHLREEALQAELAAAEGSQPAQLEADRLSGLLRAADARGLADVRALADLEASVAGFPPDAVPPRLRERAAALRRRQAAGRGEAAALAADLGRAEKTAASAPWNADVARLRAQLAEVRARGAALEGKVAALEAEVDAIDSEPVLPVLLGEPASSPETQRPEPVVKRARVLPHDDDSTLSATLGSRTSSERRTARPTWDRPGDGSLARAASDLQHLHSSTSSLASWALDRSQKRGGPPLRPGRHSLSLTLPHAPSRNATYARNVAAAHPPERRGAPSSLDPHRISRSRHSRFVAPLHAAQQHAATDPASPHRRGFADTASQPDPDCHSYSSVHTGHTGRLAEDEFHEEDASLLSSKGSSPNFDDSSSSPSSRRYMEMKAHARDAMRRATQFLDKVSNEVLSSPLATPPPGKSFASATSGSASPSSASREFQWSRKSRGDSQPGSSQRDSSLRTDDAGEPAENSPPQAAIAPPHGLASSRTTVSHPLTAAPAGPVMPSLQGTAPADDGRRPSPPHRMSSHTAAELSEEEGEAESHRSRGDSQPSSSLRTDAGEPAENSPPQAAIAPAPPLTSSRTTVSHPLAAAASAGPVMPSLQGTAPAGVADGASDDGRRPSPPHRKPSHNAAELSEEEEEASASRGAARTVGGLLEMSSSYVHALREEPKEEGAPIDPRTPIPVRSPAAQSPDARGNAQPDEPKETKAALQAHTASFVQEAKQESGAPLPTSPGRAVSGRPGALVGEAPSGAESAEHSFPIDMGDAAFDASISVRTTESPQSPQDGLNVSPDRRRPRDVQAAESSSRFTHSPGGSDVNPPSSAGVNAARAFDAGAAPLENEGAHVHIDVDSPLTTVAARAAGGPLPSAGQPVLLAPSSASAAAGARSRTAPDREGPPQAAAEPVEAIEKEADSEPRPEPNPHVSTAPPPQRMEKAKLSVPPAAAFQGGSPALSDVLLSTSYASSLPEGRLQGEAAKWVLSVEADTGPVCRGDSELCKDYAPSASFAISCDTANSEEMRSTSFRSSDPISRKPSQQPGVQYAYSDSGCSSIDAGREASGVQTKLGSKRPQLGLQLPKSASQDASLTLQVPPLSPFAGVPHTYSEVYSASAESSLLDATPKADAAEFDRTLLASTLPQVSAPHASSARPQAAAHAGAANPLGTLDGGAGDAAAKLAAPVSPCRGVPHVYSDVYGASFTSAAALGSAFGTHPVAGGSASVKPLTGICDAVPATPAGAAPVSPCRGVQHVYSEMHGAGFASEADALANPLGRIPEISCTIPDGAAGAVRPPAPVSPRPGVPHVYSEMYDHEPSFASAPPAGNAGDGGLANPLSGIPEAKPPAPVSPLGVPHVYSEMYVDSTFTPAVQAGGNPLSGIADLGATAPQTQPAPVSPRPGVPHVYSNVYGTGDAAEREAVDTTEGLPANPLTVILGAGAAPFEAPGRGKLGVPASPRPGVPHVYSEAFGGGFASAAQGEAVSADSIGDALANPLTGIVEKRGTFAPPKGRPAQLLPDPESPRPGVPHVYSNVYGAGDAAEREAIDTTEGLPANPLTVVLSTGATPFEAPGRGKLAVPVSPGRGVPHVYSEAYGANATELPASTSQSLSDSPRGGVPHAHSDLSYASMDQGSFADLQAAVAAAINDRPGDATAPRRGSLPARRLSLAEAVHLAETEGTDGAGSPPRRKSFGDASSQAEAEGSVPAAGNRTLTARRLSLAEAVHAAESEESDARTTAVEGWSVKSPPRRPSLAEVVHAAESDESDSPTTAVDRRSVKSPQRRQSLAEAVHAAGSEESEATTAFDGWEVKSPPRRLSLAETVLAVERGEEVVFPPRRRPSVADTTPPTERGGSNSAKSAFDGSLPRSPPRRLSLAETVLAVERGEEVVFPPRRRPSVAEPGPAAESGESDPATSAFDGSHARSPPRRPSPKGEEPAAAAAAAGRKGSSPQRRVSVVAEPGRERRRRSVAESEESEATRGGSSHRRASAETVIAIPAEEPGAPKSGTHSAPDTHDAGQEEAESDAAANDFSASNGSGLPQDQGEEKRSVPDSDERPLNTPTSPSRKSSGSQQSSSGDTPRHSVAWSGGPAREGSAPPSDTDVRSPLRSSPGSDPLGGASHGKPAKVPRVRDGSSAGTSVAPNATGNGEARRGSHGASAPRAAGAEESRIAGRPSQASSQRGERRGSRGGGRRGRDESSSDGSQRRGREREFDTATEDTSSGSDETSSEHSSSTALCEGESVVATGPKVNTPEAERAFDLQMQRLHDTGLGDEVDSDLNNTANHPMHPKSSCTGSHTQSQPVKPEAADVVPTNHPTKHLRRDMTQDEVTTAAAKTDWEVSSYTGSDGGEEPSDGEADRLADRMQVEVGNARPQGGLGAPAAGDLSSSWDASPWAEPNVTSTSTPGSALPSSPPLAPLAQKLVADRRKQRKTDRRGSAASAQRRGSPAKRRLAAGGRSLSPEAAASEATTTSSTSSNPPVRTAPQSMIMQGAGSIALQNLVSRARRSTITRAPQNPADSVSPLQAAHPMATTDSKLAVNTPLASRTSVTDSIPAFDFGAFFTKRQNSSTNTIRSIHDDASTNPENDPKTDPQTPRFTRKPPPRSSIPTPTPEAAYILQRVASAAVPAASPQPKKSAPSSTPSFARTFGNRQARRAAAASPDAAVATPESRERAVARRAAAASPDAAVATPETAIKRHPHDWNVNSPSADPALDPPKPPHAAQRGARHPAGGRGSPLSPPPAPAADAKPHRGGAGGKRKSPVRRFSDTIPKLAMDHLQAPGRKRRNEPPSDGKGAPLKLGKELSRASTNMSHTPRDARYETESEFDATLRGIPVRPFTFGTQLIPQSSMLSVATDARYETESEFDASYRNSSTLLKPSLSAGRSRLVQPEISTISNVTPKDARYETETELDEPLVEPLIPEPPGDEDFGSLSGSLQFSPLHGGSGSEAGGPASPPARLHITTPKAADEPEPADSQPPRQESSSTGEAARNAGTESPASQRTAQRLFEGSPAAGERADDPALLRALHALLLGAAAEGPVFNEYAPVFAGQEDKRREKAAADVRAALAAAAALLRLPPPPASDAAPPANLIENPPSNDSPVFARAPTGPRQFVSPAPPAAAEARGAVFAADPADPEAGCPRVGILSPPAPLPSPAAPSAARRLPFSPLSPPGPLSITRNTSSSTDGGGRSHPLLRAPPPAPSRPPAHLHFTHADSFSSSQDDEPDGGNCAHDDLPVEPFAPRSLVSTPRPAIRRTTPRSIVELGLVEEEPGGGGGGGGGLRITVRCPPPEKVGEEGRKSRAPRSRGEDSAPASDARETRRGAEGLSPGGGGRHDFFAPRAQLFEAEARECLLRASPKAPAFRSHAAGFFAKRPQGGGSPWSTVNAGMEKSIDSSGQLYTPSSFSELDASSAARKKPRRAPPPVPGNASSQQAHAMSMSSTNSAALENPLDTWAGSDASGGAEQDAGAEKSDFKAIRDRCLALGLPDDATEAVLQYVNPYFPSPIRLRKPAGPERHEDDVAALSPEARRIVDFLEQTCLSNSDEDQPSDGGLVRSLCEGLGVAEPVAMRVVAKMDGGRAADAVARQEALRRDRDQAVAVAGSLEQQLRVNEERLADARGEASRAWGRVAALAQHGGGGDAAPPPAEEGALALASQPEGFEELQSELSFVEQERDLYKAEAAGLRSQQLSSRAKLRHEGRTVEQLQKENDRLSDLIVGATEALDAR